METQENKMYYVAKCDICGGMVANGPDCYNGTKVDGFGYVCRGCMLATGTVKGEQGTEVVARLSKYKADHETSTLS